MGKLGRSFTAAAVSADDAFLFLASKSGDVLQVRVCL